MNDKIQFAAEMKPNRKTSKIVILDRDGVINARKGPYVVETSQFEFLPKALKALKLLKKKGYRVHIASNQSCVARGLLSMQKLNEITHFMLEKIRKFGGEIESVQYCPHHPDDNCNCRKPKTGLLKKIENKYKLNLKGAWLIGDDSTDIQAGNKAGCRTILISANKSSDKFNRKKRNSPDYISKDLYTAVTSIILNEE